MVKIFRRVVFFVLTFLMNHLAHLICTMNKKADCTSHLCALDVRSRKCARMGCRPWRWLSTPHPYQGNESKNTCLHVNHKTFWGVHPQKKKMSKNRGPTKTQELRSGRTPDGYFFELLSPKPTSRVSKKSQSTWGKLIWHRAPNFMHYFFSGKSPPKLPYICIKFDPPPINGDLI